MFCKDAALGVYINALPENIFLNGTFKMLPSTVKKHKNQTNNKLRKLDASTVEDYFNVCRITDLETNNLLLYPCERSYEETQRMRILREVKEGLLIGFIAYNEENMPIGYILGIRKPFAKVKHVMHVVIALVSEYYGKGYATLLIKSLEKEGKKQEICILRLSVLATNMRAILFYQKSGFHVEGVLTHNMKLEDRLVSELSMYKSI